MVSLTKKAKGSNRALMLGIVAVLCFVGGVSVALARAGSPPDDWSFPENLSPDSDRASAAQLARDPTSRDLYAVWVEGTFGVEEIVGRHWSSASQSWAASQNLSNFAWEDGGPAILFDQQEQGLLLWTRRYATALGAPTTGTDLVWRLWNGSDWSAEQVLLHVDSYLPGNYNLVLAESSDAVLLFVVWNGGFRQAEFRNGEWSALTPWDYHLGVSFAQVLVDEEGTWHVAGYGPNDNPGAPAFYDAYYVRYEGGTWSDPINLSAANGTATSVGMAFDNQGRLHFLWSDSFSPYSESLESTIWERIYDTTWSPNSEVLAFNPEQAVDEFSLAADLSGTLHLAWSEGILVDYVHTDMNIYYQTGDGVTWEAEEKVYTSTLASRSPALVMDQGTPFLVWLEGPSVSRDVYFSRRVVPGPCLSLDSVALDGPITGTVGVAQTFVASASPLTATWPLTYTWQASEQPPIVHTGGFVDTIDFTWSATVTAVYSILIEPVRYHYFYLPWVLKEALPVN
jgi:hypothetical protein